MHCHQHDDRAAVAVCKHCMKGLCADCARESPSGVSCSDACAAWNDLKLRELRRSDVNISLQRLGPAFLALFLVVVGAGFVVWALLTDPVRTFSLSAGCVFIVFGAVAYAVWRRFPDAG